MHAPVDGSRLGPAHHELLGGVLRAFQGRRALGWHEPKWFDDLERMGAGPAPARAAQGAAPPGAALRPLPACRPPTHSRPP